MANHLSVKKIGFFGGTFDPIHFGHLNLAVNLFEATELDELIFSPARTSPAKQDAHPIANAVARKEMIELAIEGFPHFSCIDWELKQEGPSYTIHVIEHLKEKEPDAMVYLLIGEDALSGLAQWKDVKKLLDLGTFLVGTRLGAVSTLLPPILESYLRGSKFPIPTMEISSTVIRQRLAKKKCCNHLVPSKVLDYIEANRVYSQLDGDQVN